MIAAIWFWSFLADGTEPDISAQDTRAIPDVLGRIHALFPARAKIDGTPRDLSMSPIG